MKKLLFILFILAFTGTCLADVMPPYVAIENAASISGGNDAVYVSENDGTNLDGSPVPDITILTHIRSTLPIRRGNIPTRENSLLNPNDPVEITAQDRTITIADWGGDYVYSVRLFNSNGEAVEVNSEEDSRKYPITVNLSSQTEDYYLEIMQSDTENDADSEPEFCYVLLRMKTSGHDRAITSHDKVVTSRLGNPVKAIDDIYRQYRKEAEDNPY